MASNHLNIANTAKEAVTEDIVMTIDKSVRRNKHNTMRNLSVRLISTILAKTLEYHSANLPCHQTISRGSITGIIATPVVLTLKTVIPAMNAGNPNKATSITLHMPTQWVAAIKENTKVCLGTRHKTIKSG